ncbi:hypothetical protein [Leeuwenhoekiella blandensis]|uniref:Uncharacterized protein n=1 Tax=Leeuwenhoekiella blandensis (strain CECT 7118 / CCUG 51940 / KCTC 22103 / MED217) TaxID=398720 RepID=A3XHE8_LEEBM|nr:hypothetical protein [Leeuwenhoekiella blandensis]EAQ51297.1 hypothetical protein MED217_17180 [Leeuwenhoekiella blandensis MED217]
MAKLDSKNGLQGNIGNLVFRNVNGKTIVQSRPDTAGKARKGRAKQTATDFGRASQITSSLFRGLRPFLSTHYDPQFFNRFRKAVYQGMKMTSTLPQGSLDFWQGEPTVLEGLETDLKHQYPQYVQLPGLQVSLEAGTLEINVPQFKANTNLYWPVKASEAELGYWISVYDSKTYQVLRHELFRIPIPHKTRSIPASRFTATALPAEALLLVTTGVLYFTADMRLGKLGMNSKAFNPTQVLKVFRT